MIIGHQHLIKDFKQLVKSGRLAHGYIFFGEPQVGKFYFAKHLANLLENGEFEVIDRPLQDLMIIDSSTSVDLETDAISIESVRLIKNFIYKKPAISVKRMLVIDNAENLTDKAQAAILKIAEEPPESALLVLIVDNPEVLLPTILSRFQKIYFGAVKEAELGRPGRAAIKKTAIFKTAEKYAADFMKLPESRRSALIKDLVEDQKEQPEILDLFFEELILKLNQDPVKNHKTLKSALHRLFLIKNYNTNKRLQLEAIQ